MPTIFPGCAKSASQPTCTPIECAVFAEARTAPLGWRLPSTIASGPERNKGWLRAIFDPQMGTALSAIHGRVNTPWTVESMAEAAGMSRSAFAARFKELLGQTPLEYVTEWRMQKAMQQLQQRDRKLIDVFRSVGYESDAALMRSHRRSAADSKGMAKARDRLHFAPCGPSEPRAAASS